MYELPDCAQPCPAGLTWCCLMCSCSRTPRPAQRDFVHAPPKTCACMHMHMHTHALSRGVFAMQHSCCVPPLHYDGHAALMLCPTIALRWPCSTHAVSHHCITMAVQHSCCVPPLHYDGRAALMLCPTIALRWPCSTHAVSHHTVLQRPIHESLSTGSQNTPCFDVLPPHGKQAWWCSGIVFREACNAIEGRAGSTQLVQNGGHASMVLHKCTRTGMDRISPTVMLQQEAQAQNVHWPTCCSQHQRKARAAHTRPSRRTCASPGVRSYATEGAEATRKQAPPFHPLLSRTIPTPDLLQAHS